MYNIDIFQKQSAAYHSNQIAQSAGTVEYTDYYLCKGVRPLPYECPDYDTKQSDGDVGAMGNALLSLSGPLCPGVIAPDSVLSTGQIELNCVLILK